jgi:TolB protein
MKRALLVAVLLVLRTVPAVAQDTTRAVLRLLYDNPKERPGLVVLPAAGLDSVRTIVQRDLDYSDRFELIPLSAAMAVPGPGAINWAPYRAMSAALAVELRRTAATVTVRLWDVASGTVRQETTETMDMSGAGESRMAIHRLSDEIVRWVTGAPGVAASRMLFVSDNRVWRVDSDGHGPAPVTAAGRTAYSPAWVPDGRRFVFTEYQEGKWVVVLQSAATNTRQVFPTTGTTVNITPAVSSDGRRIAFSRIVDRTYAIHQANLADLCCVERLTPGRFAENLSPTYSPDGRRIAFVTNRSGSPQIYVMSSDGTDQELLVPYEYGASGASFAPEWSPDGSAIAFHRQTGGTFQIMIFDLATERVRQLTSEGSNEDPSWAPDGRHVVFMSTRTGRQQLHIIDLETARVRSIRTPGVALLPAWSRRLAGR